MEEQTSLARQRTNRLAPHGHSAQLSEIARTRAEIVEAVRALSAHRAEIAGRLDRITELLTNLLREKPGPSGR